MSRIVRINKWIFSDKVHDWCQLPYNGKKGCPMFGKRPICSPDVKRLDDEFNLKKSAILYTEFNLEGHHRRMAEKHPMWTFKQLNNVLYWQQKARRNLRIFVSKVHQEYRGIKRITYCPESQGLNVFATMAIAGHHLERTRDIKICRHVAVVEFEEESWN